MGWLGGVENFAKEKLGVGMLYLDRDNKAGVGRKFSQIRIVSAYGLTLSAGSEEIALEPWYCC